jgi:DNA excision repair protein ERCC-3
MGRILRAKRRHEQGFRSRFYTLVSQDTDEVSFSAKRKSFLVDQGYEFKIISNLSDFIPPKELKSLSYSNTGDQEDLLDLIKEQNEEVGQEEMLETAADDIAGVLNTTQKRSNAVTSEKREKRKDKNSSLFKAWKKGRSHF